MQRVACSRTWAGAGARNQGVPDGANVVDCSGKTIIPGLVDGRVFIGEPGAEHRETIASASHAAAAGGVTSIVMMPDTDPVIDDIARSAEDLATQERWPDVVQVMERMHHHYERLHDGDGKRAIMMGIRRLQRPTMLQGVARLLGQTPEKRLAKLEEKIAELEEELADLRKDAETVRALIPPPAPEEAQNQPDAASGGRTGEPSGEVVIASNLPSGP